MRSGPQILVPGQTGASATNAAEFDSTDTGTSDFEGLGHNEKIKKGQPFENARVSSCQSFRGIIGRSPSLLRTLQDVTTVAPTDSTVLILGETGTGKELIAQAVHQLSSRRNRPFAKVNCAAIPCGLLESELFGHEKGAFTGALTRRIGRFDLAHEGTLFLDEIGDIPLELQPKLLRVVQDQEFERLGSVQTVRVNTRLVAATSRDLSKMVEEGEFRSDLYYRLNVFPVRVPPLRERPEDIPLLVEYFVEKFASRMKKSIEAVPEKSIEKLIHHPWPGNIRELQNFIERSVILSSGRTLQAPLSELHHALIHGKPLLATLEEAERAHILDALQRSSWLVGGPKGAAVRLGLKRTTLAYKMTRLGIGRQSQVE
ncbi:MAG TPA: sigma 54-interacting transcriptional regulator [Candidatus Acidoferrales bacterium]|nr:sigma 54-interacting transcriptional regulator [Candidatus Acidoferrales bacterium]